MYSDIHRLICEFSEYRTKNVSCKAVKYEEM